MIIGTAGWSIAKACASDFPEEGSGLERYAAVFSGTEINSSFHRPHRASTWERWRDSVPANFRFSVKVPKTITHAQRLVDCGDLVAEFVAQASLLREKLAVLLLQLPPSFAFEPQIAHAFIADLRSRTSARIACEPRHASWFEEDADELLTKLQVARVAANPARVPLAAMPGGWGGLRYWRLHGSPIIYRSSYADRISTYTELLQYEAADCWCIFDNTASSAATGDALALRAALLQGSHTR